MVIGIKICFAFKIPDDVTATIKYVDLMPGQREWLFNKMSIWLLLGFHEEFK